jgi:hypothetical protein
MRNAPMPVHYFHCTNGTDIVLDRYGRRTRTKKDVEPLAFLVAGQMMKQAPGLVDWSEWLVTVQDRKGSLVLVVPFPAGQA